MPQGNGNVPPGAEGEKTAAPAHASWGIIALLTAASFALAFGLAWRLFGGRPDAPAAPPARAIRAADLRPFMAAVRAEDYPLMSKLGGELFTAGSKILDRETALSEFAVDSFPPHQVYAFYTALKDGTVYRVLLTLDREDRVASFLAEDMPVVP
ncbi:MAG: hypothetical protein LBT97_12825 [Planctomycetota bacterium]|jgi:hypothetical protein|nr:hypothetical protein [Planctomycetota bacterium]